MKAIEINTRTNKEGRLSLDFQLDQPDKKVRLLILLENDEETQEESWLKAVASNPAFDFLKEADEDIYTVNDGEAWYG
ncbi:MAG: hypothetical protein KJ578_05605 [Bacteroidetes bacterium]|jgi:hypothetical protein|nr:hypothetical protein [Bacteroidota bacterium]